MQRGTGVQIHMGRIAAPQMRRVVEPHTQTIAHAVFAQHRATDLALETLAAGNRGFDRDPVALLHVPALGGFWSDLVDPAKDFVAWNNRTDSPGRVVEMAEILFPVCPAQARRLYPQDTFIGADLWNCDFSVIERARFRQHRDPGHLHHVLSSRCGCTPLFP